MQRLKNYIGTSVLLFILIVANVNIQSVKSDVILLVDLWNYTNPSGMLHNGQCCDSNLFLSDCSVLNTRCTVRFKICVDSIDRMNEIANPDSCYYSSAILNGQRNMNTFNFKTNPQAKQPFIFSIDWNQAGIPRFLLKFFAIDDSSVGRSIAPRMTTEKLIDYYTIDFNGAQSIEPSPGLSTTLDWRHFSLIPGQNTHQNFETYLTLSVAMKCSTNHYTTKCNVRCVQQDSCYAGHYTCNSITGEKICMAGFKDPSTNCVMRDTSVRLCQQSDQAFCSNNGFCYQNLVQLINTTFPTCCCNQGFGGNDCSDIVSCDMNPCQNGGLCSINATTSLGSCTCRPGYKGKYCQEKIICPQDFYGQDCSVFCQATDNCQVHQMCDMNGNLQCKDGWGSFPACNFRLIDQSIDPECPFVLDLASPNTKCFNGGSCFNSACCCPTGFTGERCEITINQCVSQPCQNGGLCSSFPGGFTCICLSGYSGQLCENLIDPCLNNTMACSGAGLCVPFRNYSDFYCSCNDGYTGRICEVRVDNCQSRPCLNDATCISFQQNYYCNCPSGYTGVNCETKIDFCSAQPCIHGTCSSLNSGYVCNCFAGWTNPQNCNEDIDECQMQSVCQNNGVCVNTPGSFRCDCPPSLTGTFCEQQIDYCRLHTCQASRMARCENDLAANTFRCVCLPGYTGANCEIDVNECASQPCFNGQCVDLVNSYRCENCAQLGFTGPQCNIPIDNCASSPCVNNQFVSCINYQTTYKCMCKSGFTGTNCQINIDECASNPCQNGAPCVDHINGFSCLCQNGYMGDQCASLSVNPCQINIATNKTKCGEYGLCFPQLQTQTYFCQCLTGYEGPNCDIPSSLCQLYKPCLNGARCVDSPNRTDFTCNCPTGYTGKTCETKIDPCSKLPCNRGTCASVPNTVDSFTCLCPTGYTGQFCESIVDMCSLNQCVQNQGTCQSMFMPDGTPTFKCICMPGYTGTLCETVVNQCLNAPCRNNGTCQSMIGYHNCICPPNYSGLNCEIFQMCSTSPCSLEGTSQCIDSVSGTTSSFSCQCRLGFTGQLCDTNINECASSPCQNNATCVDLINSFACKCNGFFIGNLCEQRYDFCAESPCHTSSTCLNLKDGFQCQCPADRTGTLCDQKIDPCASLPCQNGGICNTNNIDITDFQCTCLPGFTGKSCSSIIDFCVTPSPCQNTNDPCFNSCQNNATCMSTTDGITCKCRPGFTGRYCQNKIDYCQLGIVACLNGGTCSSTANGFVCTCANGFTGARCDAVFDNCKPDTCKNGGLCRTAQDGSVYCTCEPGFTGDFCVTSINKCLTDAPCQNNGTCISVADTYACQCTSNYVGDNCESKVNFCASNPCRNGGACSDGLFGFSCTCAQGYLGEICQTRIQACDSSPCIQGSCINKDNGYECSCFSGFTGTQCQNQVDWCALGTPSNPVCQNNASCVNTLQKAMCNCVNGYSGDRCGILSNPCASQPCARGNCSLLATSTTNDYQCECPAGFTGKNCESDINECLDMTQTCYNNATCINTIGGYSCNCLNGYTGKRCELAIDNCFNSPCQNAGLCANLQGGLIQCYCVPGYSGNLCEIVNDPCASQPCRGSGSTCTVKSPTEFQCQCASGFTGTLCEQTVNPCSTLNCMNNATCISKATALNPSGYVCACLPGYSGSQCQVYTDPCQTQVRCINGGTCSILPASFNYTCACPAGFSGMNCEIVNSCLSTPCLNNALCSSIGSSGYQCLCLPGFTGINCEFKLSACTPNPCQNNATCSETSSNSITCACLPGTTGVRCETNLQDCSNKCQFGTCNGQTCECIPGYTGTNCEVDINECSLSPCQNGGTCSEPFINMFQCSCPPGFTGQHCDLTPQVCDSRPCLNGGQCQEIGYNSNQFVCTCLPGTTGSTCETHVNECASNPCLNGATCTDGSNQYSCKCALGYTGVRCEIDVNECASNPCNNADSVCSTPAVGMYQCSCKNGLSGPNCDQKSDACVARPCQNGGLCIPQLDNSFSCVCMEGFTGAFCESQLNKCLSGNCNTTFANQVLSVYARPNQIMFDSYRSCILNTWLIANPVLSETNSNTVTISQVGPIKSSIEFTNAIQGNHTATMSYNLQIVGTVSSNLLKVPTLSQFSTQCANVVLNPVTVYENYWDIYLCGFYNTPAELESIRQTLIGVWETKYPEIKSKCANCLNVDIFAEKIAHTSSSGSPVTRLQYLVYAGVYNLLIEKGKVFDVNKFPSETEINTALRLNNFQSCRGSIIKPITFSVTLCGAVRRENYPIIANDLSMAWKSELATAGGAFGNVNVVIYISDQQEFLSDDVSGPATTITYNVFVNSQQVDSEFAITYDHFRVLAAYNKDNKICKPNYPVSKAFNILTTNKICDYSSLVLPINAALARIPLPGISPTSQVKVLFIGYGVEEYLDDQLRIYYSLPIFVIVNNQFLEPSTNLDIYNAIMRRLGEFVVKSPEKFSVYNIYGTNYYRVALAFKIYFNDILPEQSLNLVNGYIKEAFEHSTTNITRSRVQIKTQRNVIVQYQHQNARDIYQLMVFISNEANNNKLYDARVESIFRLNSYLKNLIGQLSSPIQSGASKVELIDNIDEKNIIYYQDLFVMYLKNSYMEIPSLDIIKISTWLNNHWSKSSNNSQTITIVNSRLYFDHGHVVIGINYMVHGQNPQCSDFSHVERLLEDSFKTNVMSDLCDSDYSYYTHIGERPTRSFYYIDVIGELDSREPVYVDILQIALLNAWKKEYSDYASVSFPILANKFFKRIGSLGTLISRVYYTININNQRVLTNYKAAPSYQKIEAEFNSVGSDFRIYPTCNSLAKTKLASLYIKAYPLKPDDRELIELNIRTALIQLNVIQPALNNKIVVAYSELYQSQTFGYNVSRIYYSLHVNDLFVYPCELTKLYSTSLLAVPTPTTFDYMVKSRHLDIVLPNSNSAVYINDIIHRIQFIWHLNQNQPGMNLTAIDVKLADTQFYTSKFRPLIQRIHYFLTINKKNVNDNDASSVLYREPTLSYFNQFIMPNANVSFLMPLKALRIYLDGNNVGIDTVQQNLTAQWIEANPQYLFKNLLSVKNCEENKVVQINSLISPDGFKFYNSSNNANLTRVIYSGLFNSYADQNDLFSRTPTLMTYQINNLNRSRFEIPVCKDTSCIPALFYDYFTENSINIAETSKLVFGTRDAWFKQNNKQSDLGFQRQLDVKMQSVIPYCATNSTRKLYRVFYSAGLKANDLKMDITDFLDPSDKQYSSSLGDKAVIADRSGYDEYMVPCSANARSVDDIVVGMKWWMILIIAIAAILGLILVIMCLYCLRTKKLNNKKSESNFGLYSKTDRTQLTDMNSSSLSTTKRKVSSFKLTKSGNKSKKSTAVASSAKKNTAKLGFFHSFRVNGPMHPASRLNQPQQYEAKIN